MNLSLTHINIKKNIKLRRLCGFVNSFFKRKSIKTLRKIIETFEFAVDHSIEGDTIKYSSNQARINRILNKETINVLLRLDVIFSCIIGIDDENKIDDFTNKKTNNKLNSMLKKFFEKILKIFTSISNSDILIFIMRCMRLSCKLLAPHMKLMRQIIHASTNVLGNDIKLQYQNNLLIREIAITYSGHIRETIIKGALKTHLKNIKTNNFVSKSHLRFMTSSIIKLMLLSSEACYNITFEYLRHVSLTIMSKKLSNLNSLNRIHNLQFINGLEFWSLVIASSRGQSNMRPLVYPSVLLIYYLINIKPAPIYLLFRVRMLLIANKILEESGTFVPLKSVFDCLESIHLDIAHCGQNFSVEIKKKLKVSKKILREYSYQQKMIKIILYIISKYLIRYVRQFEFPELSFIIFLKLRKFLEKTSVKRICNYAKLMMQAIEATSHFIIFRRKRSGNKHQKHQSTYLISKINTFGSLSPIYVYNQYVKLKIKSSFSILEN
jgi:hypothetical protein